jgi:hypothetical protein
MVLVLEPAPPFGIPRAAPAGIAGLPSMAESGIALKPDSQTHYEQGQTFNV